MILFKRDSNGRNRIVEIYSEGNKVIQKHGLVDGKLVTNESVCTPKNIGKSNETTAEQQAEFEAQSKIKKKFDEGYVETIEEAESQEIVLPQLAKDYKKEFKKVTFPAWVSRKLDGMRSLKTNKNMISRKGLVIDTLPHLSSIQIEEGVILDGELINVSKSFQENMKLIKKNRPESISIEYHVYDLISDEPFIKRYEKLKEVVKDKPYIKLVESYEINSEEELIEYHKQFLKEGYEGTMLRYSDDGYHVDKRTDKLLKYKDFLDEVATIVDVVPSEKRPDHAQFICEMNGKTFGCGMKFSHADRVEMLENKEVYIGQKCELRFFEYTDENFPRFPVACGIRSNLDR